MYLLGTIVGTHGIKGEVKLNCQYPHFDFGKTKQIFIGGNAYTLTAARSHKNNILLSLQEITSLSAAETLRNQKAEIADKPDTQTILYEDVLQKKVYALDGAYLGIVTEVIQSAAHDVLVVTDTSEILIPLLPNFVKEIGETITADIGNL